MNDSTENETTERVGRSADAVPASIRIAGDVSWRILAVAGVLVVVAWVAGALSTLVIPIAVALLLAALLAPLVGWLRRRRVPRTLATVLVLVFGLLVVGGVITAVVSTVISGLPGLSEQGAQSVRSVHQWLQQGPLHLSQGQLDQGFEQLTGVLQNNRNALTSGAFSTASALGSVLSGLLLVLFSLLFFLRDGRRIWNFAVCVSVPAGVRSRVEVAGLRAFASLVAYVRATAAVAVMDAAGIGLGAALVGVPLSAALAALVFLGAFIPYVGAILTGSVAVLMALVTTGPVPALIVLIVVIVVMQLEGHVLQPLVLGHAVRLHPLAVLLGITAGFLVAGAVGAVFAVPLIAVCNSGIRSLLYEESDADGIDPTDPHEAQVSSQEGQSSREDQSSSGDGQSSAKS